MAASFPVRLAVGLGFALAAAGATSALVSHRDSVFLWDRAKVHGRFEPRVGPKLVESARAFAESKHPGQACVAHPLGIDDKFAFFTVGCAQFAPEGASARVESGDQNAVPARFRYSGDAVTSFERPPPETYENSLRRLFPLEAAKELDAHALARSDFLVAGLARMREVFADKR